MRLQRAGEVQGTVGGVSESSLVEQLRVLKGYLAVLLAV